MFAFNPLAEANAGIEALGHDVGQSVANGQIEGNLGINPHISVMQSTKDRTTEYATNSSTARETGASLSKDRCVRVSL